MLTGEESVKVAVSANIWDDVMTGCKMHRTVSGFITFFFAGFVHFAGWKLIYDMILLID